MKIGTSLERKNRMTPVDCTRISHPSARGLVQSNAQFRFSERMSQARCLCQAEKRMILHIENVKAVEVCDVTKEVASTGQNGSDLEPGAFPCPGRRRGSRGPRELFRLFWKHKSQACSRKLRLLAETISLIKEMAANQRRLVSAAHPWRVAQTR